MWRKRAHDKDDTDLKEALLRRLSHTVQEVQLYCSQTGETCTTQEGTSALITVLEAIFLHALKRSLLETARKSFAVTDEQKPAPSFIDAVQNATHKDTMAVIFKQSRIKTDVGRSRVWIRLALNEGATPCYLATLTRDRLISRHYRPSALLRDKDALDTAARILEGLITVQFDIPVNSSLLNSWSSEPLLISGIWSPALRNSVQTAVDVASNIDDDETCSILTASSSVRSLMTLDESQAFQIILETPRFSENMDLPSDTDIEIDETIQDQAQEREMIMQRSFSTLVADCSSQTESILTALAEKDAEEHKKKMQEQRIEVGNDDSCNKDDKPDISDGNKQTAIENSNEINSDIPAQTVKKPVEVPDYSELLEVGTYGEKERLEQFLADKKDVRKRASSTVKRTLDDIIFKMPREVGLRQQKYECTDCRLSIGLDFGTAVLCHVTGEYLCENCHKYSVGVVPARIIFNWDHSKYPTGQRAAKYLTSKINAPIFNLDQINPKLYSVVNEMQEILHLRKQLNFLYLYIKTCKQGGDLSIREYLVKTVHLYSLSDLISVPNGDLKAELCKVADIGRAHVVNCWICKEKGFICEVCRDPQVIYPFDEEAIYRCQKCQAVYHGQCISSERICPKCKRRKERQNERVS